MFVITSLPNHLIGMQLAQFGLPRDCQLKLTDDCAERACLQPGGALVRLAQTWMSMYRRFRLR